MVSSFVCFEFKKKKRNKKSLRIFQILFLEKKNEQIKFN